jgi:hypothetical protein
MTETTLTFELRPAPPALSEANRRSVAAWLSAAVPPLRALPPEAACEAAAHLVSDVLAFGVLAGKERADILSSVLSRAVRDDAAAGATVDAMGPDELALSGKIGHSIRRKMREPGATSADAVQLFFLPLSPDDESFMLGQFRQWMADIEPAYRDGLLRPAQVKLYERMVQWLANQTEVAA